ncbi:hypothetical protein Cs7R123_71590 [Catellatospora sp. TT07R-123]|uniref:hypothetical protein n=1 Tax=Catellatospora sp. TT07R-123 TaxID=2733863 RepID=UPI001B063C60|nr:hypothetical protein [Catellatospora sp. TT07R-123]GHJ49817.1 hypothetical protein Cs7R123_71590 [Catellatospora sp. TT07R-123]
MSPLPHLRRSAFALALLAFVLHTADRFWWQPRFERLNLAVDLLLGQALPLAVIVGLTWWVFGRVVRPYRTAPAAFDVEAGTFTAPSAPAVVGSQAILWGLLAAYAVPARSAPGGGSRVLYPDGSDNIAGVVFTLLLLAGAAMWLWRGPRVTLTPHGLRIRTLRTRSIPWTELLTGGPAVPVPKQSQLWLNLSRPGGAERWVALTLSPLYVDGAFLARAIRHYAEHPEDRAAIGTDAEHSRLTEALTVPAA